MRFITEYIDELLAMTCRQKDWCRPSDNLIERLQRGVTGRHRIGGTMELVPSASPTAAHRLYDDHFHGWLLAP
jgi:hypothetical protein